MFKPWNKMFAPTFDITIYMKSGNQIKVKKISNIKYKYDGDDITSLSIVQEAKDEGLLVDTLNLNQVEAIKIDRMRQWYYIF